MFLRRDKLDGYYQSEKMPCWKVYNGRSVRGNPMKSHMTDDGVDEGLALLNDFLDMVDGGIVTITLHTSGTSKASSQMSIQLGEAKVNGAGNTSVQRDNSFDQMMRMFSMSQGMMQKQMESMTSMVKLQFENEALKKEIEQGEPMSAKETLMMELATSVSPVIQGMFGVSAPAAQLGTLGQGEDTTEETNDQQKGGTKKFHPNKVSIDHIVEDCKRIQKALPGTHINVLMRGLANWIVANPEKAKQMLGAIIPKP